MRRLLAAVLLVTGCQCGPSATPDAGEFLAKPSTPARPLFDGDAGGLELDFANVVGVWQTVPATEAAAQQQVRVLRASLAAIEASGVTGADRLAAKCEPLTADQRDSQLLCLRLLSYTESPRSLALLATRARTPLPTPTDTGLPSAEALTRLVATHSLARRASTGSAPALDTLLLLAAEPDESIRASAVSAVFDALPRWKAKSKLRAVLPEAERWRLYQSR